MNNAKRQKYLWVDPAILLVEGILYIVPFLFIILTASKAPAEAALFKFTWPAHFQLLKNIFDVVTFDHGRMLLALWNSTIITLLSVVLTVFFAALIAVVLQRRVDGLGSIVSSLMLAGLIIPPAVVPTIFVLQKLFLYKSIAGLVSGITSGAIKG